MKKKQIFILVIILIIIVVVLAINILKNDNDDSTNDNISTNKIENEIENTNEISEGVEELKNTVDENADLSLFEVAEEYDGRQVLIIKPTVQFKTALAGALKNGMPTEEEIEEEIANISFEAGIFITEQSRDSFENLLEENNITGFSIDDDGYIVKTDEINDSELSKALEEVLNSGKVYFIDMTGICYMRDELTGEITEYPFEQMDPYQICEPFYSDDAVFLAVTSNSSNYLSSEEILEGILSY